MKLTDFANMASIPLTILGFWLSTSVAGVGHGSYLPFMAFFPLASLMLAAGLPVFALAAACLQFPLYALAINAASKSGWLRPLIWVLLGMHILPLIFFIFM